MRPRPHSIVALALVVALLGCGEFIGPHPSTYRLTTATKNVFIVEEVYTLSNTVMISVVAELWNVGEEPLEIVECGPVAGRRLISQLVKQSQLADLSAADMVGSCAKPTYRSLASGQRRVDTLDLDGDDVVIDAPASEADPVVLVVATRRGLLVSEPILGLPTVVDVAPPAPIRR